MTNYENLEKQFFSIEGTKKRLEFLCALKAQSKAIDAFIKDSYDWVLEQTDTDLKASGVSYKFMPAVRRLSGPAIRKADPELYSSLMELYSSESKEYIQVCFKGVKK